MWPAKEQNSQNFEQNWLFSFFLSFFYDRQVEFVHRIYIWLKIYFSSTCHFVWRPSLIIFIYPVVCYRQYSFKAHLLSRSDQWSDWQTWWGKMSLMSSGLWGSPCSIFLLFQTIWDYIMITLFNFVWYTGKHETLIRCCLMLDNYLRRWPNIKTTLDKTSTSRVCCFCYLNKVY